MVGDLPSESQIGEMILADLTSDFQGRVFRQRTLLALDADFAEAHVMLPGGQASWVAYVEARSSFVAGNFAATILLSQSLIENLLGGHLIIDDVGREVRQGGPRVGKPPRKRPHLRELIDHAIEAGVIALDDVDGIQRIMDMRNPLVHFRNINDSQNLTRRAMETGIHPDDLLFDDARSAISMTIRLIGNSQRALDRFR